MVIFEYPGYSIQSVSSKRRFQVVIMATGAFAVPSMRALCESGNLDIVCLVTAPLRYDKHGSPLITPARQAAEEYDLPISEQIDVNSKEFFDFLYLVRPDLIFVCDFGQILSRKTLSGSIVGGINLHGSLLPRFRGAAPVHWAILTGEHSTGVSIIHMTPQIDAGPVIAQSPPIPISPYETVIELEERLAEYGAKLVFDVISQMAHDETVRIIEQLHDRVSKAPRLKKEDGFVPWDKSSQDIFNHYRATVPWPRAFTDWHRASGAPLRLILGAITPLDDSLTELVWEDDFSQVPLRASMMADAKMDNLAKLRATPTTAADTSPLSSSPLSSLSSSPLSSSSSHRPEWWLPGTVIYAEDDLLIVAAKEGAVRIERLQPAGKKMMHVRDFLRGYPMAQGDRLGHVRLENVHSGNAPPRMDRMLPEKAASGS